MIPMIVFKNPFFSWVLTSAMLYSGLFWAYYVGLIAYILHADFTGIAAVLMIVLIYCNLSLGWMAHRLQQIILDGVATADFYAKYDTIGLFMFISPTLGLLGTVIGLSRLMKDAATVDIDTIVALMGTGTGSALFPTAIGLFSVIVLTVQKFLQTHSFRIHDFDK